MSERRVLPGAMGGEVRVLRAEGAKPKIEGYAAVFGQLTDLRWFQEKIEPGAFDDVLGDDVRGLFNHDPNYVLARTTSGTLKIASDERGLRMEAEPPDATWARDLLVSIDRGDITGQSFSFDVAADKWEYHDDDTVTRTILKLSRLYDVGPVTFPAYEGTDVAVRSGVEVSLATIERAKAVLTEHAKRFEPWRLDALRRRLELAAIE